MNPLVPLIMDGIPKQYPPEAIEEALPHVMAEPMPLPQIIAEVRGYLYGYYRFSYTQCPHDVPMTDAERDALRRVQEVINARRAIANRLATEETIAWRSMEECAECMEAQREIIAGQNRVIEGLMEYLGSLPYPGEVPEVKYDPN